MHPMVAWFTVLLRPDMAAMLPGRTDMLSPPFLDVSAVTYEVYEAEFVCSHTKIDGYRGGRASP